MKDFYIRGCAQRLAASQVWAVGSLITTLTSASGAQRLAASQVWAEDELKQVHQKLAVLNALRHHRFGQRWVRNGCLPVGGVLNALRHHRFGQSMEEAWT